MRLWVRRKSFSSINKQADASHNHNVVRYSQVRRICVREGKAGQQRQQHPWPQQLPAAFRSRADVTKTTVITSNRKNSKVHWRCKQMESKGDGGWLHPRGCGFIYNSMFMRSSISSWPCSLSPSLSPSLPPLSLGNKTWGSHLQHQHQCELHYFFFLSLWQEAELLYCRGSDVLLFQHAGHQYQLYTVTHAGHFNTMWATVVHHATCF